MEVEDLPFEWVLPGAHRFPDENILLVAGGTAVSKDPFLLLNAGETTWTPSPPGRRYVGHHSGQGARLWVEIEEEDERGLGWLSSDGQFHPAPHPMDVRRELASFVAHPDGSITAWSGVRASGILVRQGDGSDWRTLPPPPVGDAFGGWGNAEGEFVLVGFTEPTYTGHIAQVAVAWRGGAWVPTPLPVQPDDPDIVVGPRRSLLFTPEAALTLSREGDDPQVLDVPDALRETRNVSGAALPDGRFLLVGGMRGDRLVDQTWILEESGEFTVGPRLAQTRRHSTVVVDEDRGVLVIGGQGEGWDPGLLRDVEALVLP